MVDPPIAAQTLTPFSNAGRVSTSAIVAPALTSSTMRLPVRCAIALRLASTPGMVPLNGSDSPIASKMHASVEAVPIVMHVPGERDMLLSAAMNSSFDIVPARTASLNRQTSVPDPISLPRNLPLSIGPELTSIAGSPTDAAPISIAGEFLSQPPSRTTPSIA